MMKISSGIFSWLLAGMLYATLLYATQLYAESTPRIFPYLGDAEWAQLPAGRSWGAPSGIEVDPDGRSVWVLERCGGDSCATSTIDPILKLSPTGNIERSFGGGMLVFPHGLFVDQHGNVFVTDAKGDGHRGHQILKFSPQGKLLLTLGKAGIAGEDEATFNMPADVAVAPNGDIFVADGHIPVETNMRIVKFSASGQLIKSWGGKGSAPGQLKDPHALAFDSQGRLFVADRGNRRIQIFDQQGNFIAAWTQFGTPSGIYITADDRLYVADLKAGIRIGSARDGRVEAFMRFDADSAADAKNIRTAESVAVDRFGNIYAGENAAMRLLKFPSVHK